MEEGVGEWEEAYFASNLLQELDTPGLAILAAMAKCKKNKHLETMDLIFLDNPKVEGHLYHDPQIFIAGGDGKIPEGRKPLIEYNIPYNGIVVEESARRLQEKRLITPHSHGRGSWNDVTLTALGEFIVHWTTAG